MDSASLSGSNLKIEGCHPVESQCKTRLNKLLDCVRKLFRQWVESGGRADGLGFISGGSLLDVLVSTSLWPTLFTTELDDVCSVFFRRSEPGRFDFDNCIVKEDLVLDLVHACAIETSKLVVQDLGNDYYGIVVDVFSDRDSEQYLAVCLRYVDKTGKVMERFLGMVHIGEATATALSLKSALDSFLREHSLSLSKLRGQSYDGASRMNIESVFNGLVTLVREETRSAYYVHSFAQQLQSTLLAVAERNVMDCVNFFMTIEDLAKLVNSTSNQKEISQESATQAFLGAFRFTERGFGVRNAFDQDSYRDTPDLSCWGFEQLNSLLKVVNLFPTIADVLDIIANKASDTLYRIRAEEVFFRVLQFGFVFVAHLLTSIVGYTNEISLALQRNDILNALSLVPVVKGQLQRMRDSGWETLMNEISAFCAKNDEVEACDMDAVYAPYGGRRFRDEKVTNLHHYQVDVFFSVIDLQLEELNFWFNEVSSELLICIACLSPADSFSCFDKQKLIRLAQLYPDEFSSADISSLEIQLDNYIIDMRRDDRFSNLNDLNELSVKLVETKKHLVWSQVYLLLRLVLVLPVLTANYESLSPEITCVRRQVESSISDQPQRDIFIILVERHAFSRVPDDDVLNHLQAIRTSRQQV